MEEHTTAKTDLMEEILNLREHLLQSKQAPFLDVKGNHLSGKNTLQVNSVFFDFMETIPILIYVFKKDRFIYVNPALQTAMGYSYDEIMNMKFWDMAHPDFRNFVSQRGIARQSGEDVPARYGIKAIKKSGEEIWVDLFNSGFIQCSFPMVLCSTDLTICYIELANCHR